MSSGARGEWQTGDGDTGSRLDRALAARLGVARNRVQGWIAAGRVRVDGEPVSRAGATLRPGQRIEWEEPPAFDDRIVPEAGPLRVLWSDADVVVLDKPADLVVHPGAGRATGTLVHRLLAAYPELAGVGGPGRPGIVHRLDRDTTGCLVVARTRESYDALSKAFAARGVDKLYMAIVWGRPRDAAGTISAPIGRHPHERQRMAVRPRGRPATTHWRTVASGGGVSLLAVRIETGRTHQIRVHLKHLGHPIVGDPVYGEERHRSLRGAPRRALESFPRPALHARRITFQHPRTDVEIACEAAVPPDLERLWNEATGSPWPRS